MGIFRHWYGQVCNKRPDKITCINHMFFDLFFATLLLAKSLTACIIAFFSNSLILLLGFSHIIYFCLTSIVTGPCLDSFSFSNRTLLDTRHLTFDILHTPNLSHGHTYNQNTGLLTDCMYNTCMTSDFESGPMVSALTIICALNTFFFFLIFHQNLLSSPFELCINRISEEQFLASRNNPYLQAQLVVECQKQKIVEMKNHIQMLDMNVVMWKTRFTTIKWASFMQIMSSLTAIRKTLNKVIQNASNTGLGSSTILITCKDLPFLLNPKDYSEVHFWTTKSFEAYCNYLRGKQDKGLETRLKKRSQCQKSDTKNRHSYLKNMNGSAIPWDILVKVGQKTWRLWHALNITGKAPPSWGKASKNTYKYFNSEMLNNPEFKFFRYCKDNWKITQWATKAYAFWVFNHIKASNESEAKTVHMKRRRHNILNNPFFL